MAFVLPAIAQDRRVDIDPNTRIQGGADVRGSGANAGASADAQSDKNEKVERPEKSEPEKDKPISERKPQERAPEDASRGGTKPPE